MGPASCVSGVTGWHPLPSWKQHLHSKMQAALWRTKYSTFSMYWPTPTMAAREPAPYGVCKKPYTARQVSSVPSASAFLCLRRRIPCVPVLGQPRLDGSLSFALVDGLIPSPDNADQNLIAHRFQNGGCFCCSLHSSYDARAGVASLPLAGAPSLPLSTCLLLSACSQMVFVITTQSITWTT
jgi:hypothetical protein